MSRDRLNTVMPVRRPSRYLSVFLLFAGVLITLNGLWIPVKAELAQWLIARAWHSEIADARPWPWADTRPIARLQLPRLDGDWYVMQGSTGEALAFGPGHVTGSALPGDNGVSIVAGHRDTHFAALAEVKIDDTLWVEARDGARQRYRIVDMTIRDVRVDTLSSDSETALLEPRLQLITCYPFDAAIPGGPLRYVITAMAD